MSPDDLKPAVDAVATPLRRFLVAHRTGAELVVNTEQMVPAVTEIFRWANEHGYQAGGTRRDG